MKLVEKKRTVSKVAKTYDHPQTPCNRILACDQVPEATKQQLNARRAGEGGRGESPAATAGAGCVPALVAVAPDDSTPPAPAEKLAKTTPKREETNQVRVP